MKKLVLLLLLFSGSVWAQETVTPGSTTVVQPTGTNLHAVLDTTSTTACTQATGTNLHAVLDTTSTTACTQATGTNLHTVVDSGAITASGTVTANQGTANATPWNENLAQYGGSATTLGQKAMTASIPIVEASDWPGNADVTSSGSLTAACADPCQQANTTSTSVVGLVLNGHTGVSLIMTASTLVGTVKVDSSVDNLNWTSLGLVDGSSFTRTGGAAGVVNPTGSPKEYKILYDVAAGYMRVRVSAFTSGSATFTLRASDVPALNPWTFIGADGVAQATGFYSIGGRDASSNGRTVVLANASPANIEYGVIVRNIPTPSTLAVVAKSAANTAVTATLPAVAGAFHYITALRIMHTCSTALTGTNIFDVTTTNLPGSLTFSIGNACAVGTTNNDVMQEYASPIKSSAVNTNTTIVCPLLGAATFCKIEVFYYTGS